MCFATSWASCYFHFILFFIFLSEECTEVRFASFLSGGFTTVAVINPQEEKLAKRTSVEWEVFLIFALYFHIAVVIIFKNMIEKLEHLGWKLHIFESSNLLAFGAEELSRPIHLYLIFEKSSLKNWVGQTGFLTSENQFLQAT